MLRIEFEREDDGRWIAEIAELPGVMAYGATREEAAGKVEVLAGHVLTNPRSEIMAGIEDAHCGIFSGKSVDTIFDDAISDFEVQRKR